jgi:hypothetical protein
LTTGADFSDPDPDHVQAVPVKYENDLRAHAANDNADAFVRDLLTA